MSVDKASHLVVLAGYSSDDFDNAGYLEVHDRK
jgi:hypothetical protein